MQSEAKRNVDTTKFDNRFVFHEPQQFKGVVKDQKYPVISLITSRDDGFDKLQSLEAELLDRPREANFVTLFDYLEVYIKHHKIEKPELRLTAQGASVEPPEHYKKYIEEWKDDLEKIRTAKIYEESAADDDTASKQAVITQTSNPQVDFTEVLNFFVKIAAARQKKSEESPPENGGNE